MTNDLLTDLPICLLLKATSERELAKILSIIALITRPYVDMSTTQATQVLLVRHRDETDQRAERPAEHRHDLIESIVSVQSVRTR